VKFPTKIRQTIGAYPALDLTSATSSPTSPWTFPCPTRFVRRPAPYARVTSQMAADGVLVHSPGHPSQRAVEMKDHVILVESPLNDDRAVACWPKSRISFRASGSNTLIATHHHFDHAGGLGRSRRRASPSSPTT